LRFKKFISDILIIGGGGAAAMAALAASRGGAKVTLISKENSLVGGATIMSAGGTCAVFKPEDSPDIFYNDIMRGGRYLNNPRLTRILAEKSTESVLKLEDYDFVLDKSSLNPALMVKKGEGHSFPRGYLDRREGLGFCHALGKALIGSKVDFHAETIAYKLISNHGQVVGAMGFSLVTGEHLVFNAKVVILATGGLGALYKITTNARTLTGDGYAMAWDAGAELIDMEMVQFLPLAFPYPKSRQGLNIGMCSHFGPGVKLYNGLHERYMEKYDPERMEFATRDVVARANFIEIEEGRGTKNGTIVVDPVEHDINYLKRFKSFHPHIYSMCKAIYGERAANWLEPFESIPSQHFFMGGVIINENCETSIPGLFAVGEVTGGIHGANRLSGCALTELFVFGDIAGENAMLRAKKEKLLPPIEHEVQEISDQLEEIFSRRQGVRPFEVKRAIGNIMWDHFGPSRDEEGMKKGLANLKNIQENDIPHLALASSDTRYNRERMEAAEVNLMIKNAILIAHAALSRRESRGSHYRSDFPLSDDKEWLRNIVLRKSVTGGLDISYRQAPACL
jgi:fumarate reductase (CoM/CoB) subunit A